MYIFIKYNERLYKKCSMLHVVLDTIDDPCFKRLFAFATINHYYSDNWILQHRATDKHQQDKILLLMEVYKR